MAGFGCCTDKSSFMGGGGGGLESGTQTINCYHIEDTKVELRILGASKTGDSVPEDEAEDIRNKVGRNANTLLVYQMGRYPWNFTITSTRHVECVMTNAVVLTSCPKQCDVDPWPGFKQDTGYNQGGKYGGWYPESKKDGKDIVWVIKQRTCTYMMDCNNHEKCGKAKYCECGPKEITHYGNALGSDRGKGLEAGQQARVFSDHVLCSEATDIGAVKCAAFRSLWKATAGESPKWYNQIQSLLIVAVEAWLGKECQEISEQITDKCCPNEDIKRFGITGVGPENPPYTNPDYDGKWKCILPSLKHCKEVWDRGLPDVCRIMLGWCRPCKENWRPPKTPWRIKNSDDPCIYTRASCAAWTGSSIETEGEWHTCSCGSYPEFRKHMRENPCDWQIEILF